MAEKEACADLVTKTAQEQSSTGALEGESLLLPLLQGLLDAPESEQTADSGTESGEDQRSGLIAEVQLALDKLSNSLRSDSNDITPERRSSLLQLVTKLQAGLAASAPNSERRQSGGHNRFNRRKQRQSRHTVGVSSEELADARRLIEEISLKDIRPVEQNGLQKQKSESSVATSSASIKALSSKSAVRNATAKPFSASNSSNSISQSISGTSSSVQTPTEPSESLSNLFKEPQDKMFFPNSSQKPEETSFRNEAPANLLFADQKSISENAQDTEDEDDSTVKGIELQLQTNPIYHRPELSNKFNNKNNKLRMKRANTIDIPKPLNFYEDEDDSDEDCNDKRNSSYGLKGPVSVNVENRKTVPQFQPKTESDRKFLAFINKHNENTNKSLWSNANKTSVWGSKFGNLKSNFEKSDGHSNARSFWKCSDDAVKQSSASQFDPKISKRSARNLQQMFEQKQKQNWVPGPKEEVVTGSLKVNAFEPKGFKVTQPAPVNQFKHAPQSAFKPIAKKHPENLQIPGQEIIKTEIKGNQNANLDSPVFLYSPKPLTTPQTDSSSSSPLVSKPWIASSGEHRVLSLAASKFENCSQPDPVPFKPRKLSKDFNKVFGQNKDDKAAPYVPQNTNTVRKMSGQFENLGKGNDFSAQTTVRYCYNNEEPTKQPQTYQSSTYSQQYITPPLTNQFKPKYQVDQRQFDKFSKQNNLALDQYQPQNISIAYSKPNYYGNSIGQKPPEQTMSHEAPKPQQYYQHVPGNDDQYTSTCKFVPKVKPTPTVSEQKYSQRPEYMTQSSTESVHEYNAVSSQIMTGPVGQQAVSINKGPMTRDGHDMAAALGIRNSLSKFNKFETQNNIINNNLNTKSNQASVSPSNSFKYPSSPQNTLSSGSFKYKSETKTPSPKSFIETKQEAKNFGIVKPMQQVRSNGFNIKAAELQQVSEAGVVTSKFHIPVVNVPDRLEKSKPPPINQVLSKSDSWHQICMAQQVAHKPLPQGAPGRGVTKSKSSHSLAVPKQFEAAMTREEMSEKKKTVEAFFGSNKSGSTSPNPPGGAKVVKRAINRTKTSEKTAYKQSSGLCRSRTLPDIVCPELLDESNVDEAFENLFKASA